MACLLSQFLNFYTEFPFIFLPHLNSLKSPVITIIKFDIGYHKLASSESQHCDSFKILDTVYRNASVEQN